MTREEEVDPQDDVKAWTKMDLSTCIREVELETLTEYIFIIISTLTKMSVCIKLPLLISKTVIFGRKKNWNRGANKFGVPKTENWAILLNIQTTTRH